jgi:purine-binding chemotaxis protein CheW
MSVSVPALLFRAAGRAYALPVAHVIETMRALPLEKIAGAVEPILGMSIIRGAPTPVIDGGVAFAHSPSTAARLVTLRVGDRTVAIAVDEVIGVRALNHEAMQFTPRVLHGAAGGALDRVGTLDGELLLVLEATRIVSTELLETLDAAR